MVQKQSLFDLVVLMMHKHQKYELHIQQHEHQKYVHYDIDHCVLCVCCVCCVVVWCVLCVLCVVCLCMLLSGTLHGSLWDFIRTILETYYGP